VWCPLLAHAENVPVSDEPYFDHVCNYVGPSSGMEASIIVEGFKLSLSLYGVIYKNFIGHSDSNVLKKLTDPKDTLMKFLFKLNSIQNKHENQNKNVLTPIINFGAI
jgi:hypothetical protein